MDGQSVAMSIPVTKTCWWTLACGCRLSCGVCWSTHSFLYASYIRCVKRKRLLGWWPWWPIHSMRWSCSITIPVRCSQKAAKQIHFIYICFRSVYKDPASVWQTKARTGLAFPVVSSVRKSSSLDIHVFLKGPLNVNVCL